MGLGALVWPCAFTCVHFLVVGSRDDQLSYDRPLTSRPSEPNCTSLFNFSTARQMPQRSVLYVDSFKKKSIFIAMDLKCISDNNRYNW